MYGKGTNKINQDRNCLTPLNFISLKTKLPRRLYLIFYLIFELMISQEWLTTSKNLQSGYFDIILIYIGCHLCPGEGFQTSL